MKPKGKTAWLITWEGTESEYNGRCKIVAILPPKNYSKRRIETMLCLLHCSEYNHTLSEKLGYCTESSDSSFFKQHYQGGYPDYYYGHLGKECLSARKVKNLRCETSKKDYYKETLYWTEFPKMNWNPEMDENSPSPANPADWLREVRGETDKQYTYSIRAGSRAMEKRLAKAKR